MSTPIGKRTQVADIRELWKVETEFSRWLTSEAGKELLSADLGVQLENPICEMRPGDYPCDIRGNWEGDEDHVIIVENQYGKTDHDHLGKLLTHAAVHKATTGIWITERAADDHREVIDWLNQNTPQTVNFFLAELKAYRIGNSDPAPMLDVVSRPNQTVKSARSDLSPKDKERHAWRIITWERILDAIEKSKPPFRVQRPKPSHWSTIAVGRAGFTLNMYITPQKQCIGIDLWISAPWKDKAFRDLEEQQLEIESEIGEPLVWTNKPDQKSASIYLKGNIDPKNESNNAKVDEWLIKYSHLFYRAFAERVRKLSP